MIVMIVKMPQRGIKNSSILVKDLFASGQVDTFVEKLLQYTALIIISSCAMI